MLSRLTPVTTLVSGASRSRLCHDGPRVYLFGPAYMPSCRLYVQKSDFHLINVFCVVVVVKNVLCLVHVVFSYFVLHSSKIPVVLATRATHLSSLLFRQPDGVSCVVRRVYLAIIAKLSQSRVVQLVNYGC